MQTVLGGIGEAEHIMTIYEQIVWELAAASLYDRKHDYNDVVTLYNALMQQLSEQAVLDFADQQLQNEGVKAMQAQVNVIRDALFSSRKRL